jgi:hypothetical protein
MAGATPGLGRRGEHRRRSARAADRPDAPKTFVSAPRRTELSEFEIDASDARRHLRRGLISLAILVAVVIGLLLAIPGLHGVARTMTHMHAGWLAIGIVLELLSCHAYVLAFLQVFDRAPFQFGARVALTEQAVGATVSLGGAGSLAVGAWLLHERGVPPARIAERSAVLFLLTSAINVITLVLAGLGLFIGVLPGPQHALLSIVPAAIGAAVFVLFLALPRFTDRLAEVRGPGRVRSVLEGTENITRSARRTRAGPIPRWRASARPAPGARCSRPRARRAAARWGAGRAGHQGAARARGSARRTGTGGRRPRRRGSRWLLGERHGLLGWELPGRRHRVGENLEVDAAGVHVG